MPSNSNLLVLKTKVPWSCVLVRSYPLTLLTILLTNTSGAMATDFEGNDVIPKRGYARYVSPNFDTTEKIKILMAESPLNRVVDVRLWRRRCILITKSLPIGGFVVILDQDVLWYKN